MSPVGRPTSGRSAVALGSALAGVLLAVVFGVLALTSFSQSPEVDIRLGDDRFDAGDAASRATSIAEDGPLIFADLAGGSRDLVVNHIGDDPEVGWYAFEARSAGQPRECVIEWQPADEVFLEPCTGDTYPPDGEGLNQFPVEIEGGKVVIDVNAAAREAEEEEQRDATTSTVVVSGDEAP